MQKKRLTLDDLNVESFVTAVGDQEQLAMQGGAAIPFTSYVSACDYPASGICCTGTKNPKATPCPVAISPISAD